MTRAEKVATAQRLRAEGLLLREIAERMGAKLKTVSGWLSDPDLSRQRARRETYAGTCIDCGAPTDGSGGYGAPERCTHCRPRDVQVAAMRARWRPHRTMIEAMWADGLTIAQIRGATGIAAFTPGPYRQHGYDLPHRRTPEQVARITAGTRARQSSSERVAA